MSQRQSTFEISAIVHITYRMRHKTVLKLFFLNNLFITKLQKTVFLWLEKYFIEILEWRSKIVR